jgi:putative IMPACT (imprinted ancient) family translation regulator
MINIESGDCGTNYVLVHWLGRNGLMKSYVFEVESAKRGAANVVELFDSTLRDTVTYRKKMNMSLNLIARDISGCDAEYLSDIVTSNDVQAVCENWGALPVGVTNSNASYGQSRGDFKITIETKKYY